MQHKKLYTVESVTSGHPDKVCDQISDAILDECLRQDPMSRVAIETFGGHGLLVIGGELTTNAEFDAEKIARQVYKDIGYQHDLQVITRIVKQSRDIAMGVDTGGAGDQGIMYGYATDETDQYLPMGIVLAHNLTRGLERLRRNGELPWLLPDGKSQVTIKDGKIYSVLVSTQHHEGVTLSEIRTSLIKKLIKPVVGDVPNSNVYINPTGQFIKGGFDADTGLTGRKIMVDTYGGLIPHGGGAFSGKDATKVDRSAAYMARFVAKNLVAQGLVKESVVSVAYAIGRVEPMMVNVINEHGENIPAKELISYNFEPQEIIKRLDLCTPIFQQTASYGHFGRKGLPWENVG